MVKVLAVNIITASAKKVAIIVLLFCYEIPSPNPQHKMAELWAQTIIKMYIIKAVGAGCEYTNNTAQTKAETTFRIEACIKLYNQNTTPLRIVSAFCIASNCQLIRLICRKFWFWAAISHANMQLGLEILKWNSLQTLKVK